MGFKRHYVDDLVFFTIPSFDNTGLVKHCFSTKIGGISNGIVKGLNLGFSRPDSQENVMANFKLLCSAVGIEVESLVLTNQVHGISVRKVTREDRGKGIIRDSDIKNVDGLITNEKHVTLTTFYADCVPLFFLDPQGQAVGSSHAGWRGTIAGIGAETLNKMHAQFGTLPQNVLVGIGPSICRDCYEVDTPVITKLKERYDFWKEVVVPMGKEKYLFDLQQTNKQILVEAGVDEKNIIVSGLCTRCSEQIFYSYRREGECTGALAALIQLI